MNLLQVMGASLGNFCGASARHGCFSGHFVNLLLVMGTMQGIFSTDSKLWAATLDKNYLRTFCL